MPWTILYHDAFAAELSALPEAVQDALLATVSLLATYGRPWGDPMSIRWRGRATPI